MNLDTGEFSDWWTHNNCFNGTGYSVVILIGNTFSQIIAFLRWLYFTNYRIARERLRFSTATYQRSHLSNHRLASSWWLELLRISFISPRRFSFTLFKLSFAAIKFAAFKNKCRKRVRRDNNAVMIRGQTVRRVKLRLTVLRLC